MYNQRVEQILNDCDNELVRLEQLIVAFGSTHEASGYFSKYALLKVASTIELSYKTLIADHYEVLCPDLSTFVSGRVRDANMNATYDNICTMLGWFSDEVKRDYKSRIDAMEHKDRYCSEFKDLNQSRNNLVHGDTNTPSFTSTKEKYEHVKLFLEVLDEIMH